MLQSKDKVPKNGTFTLTYTSPVEGEGKVGDFDDAVAHHFSAGVNAEYFHYE